ncbi:VOC family protein [Jannaschia sp. R86511]|uniref:VOC family protein n=1 Tax=Jannaschia sp. R86511 TaxID=3093853 RepID=UPI0036D20D99
MVSWVWLFLDLPDGPRDDPTTSEVEVALEFWCAVTGSTASPWRGAHGEFTTLQPAQGDPWVKVQRVGGPGGMHLDLDVDEPLTDAAARAVDLGATVAARSDDVVVCASPGGLSFCLTPARRDGGPRQQAGRNGDRLLDQVCLDIPDDRYDTEVDFWARFTGWGVDPGRVRGGSRHCVTDRVPGQDPVSRW